MIYCSSQILHHPVVVTFIQQSWSNSKSIFLASFFTLLILISLLIYNFLFYDVVVTFIQQSWSISKSILLSFFFAFLLFLVAYSSIISYFMIYCSSQILHHPVVVTFIQQSWSNSKSIFLASFFTYLLFLILFSTFLGMMYLRQSKPFIRPAAMAARGCESSPAKTAADANPFVVAAAADRNPLFSAAAADLNPFVVAARTAADRNPFAATAADKMAAGDAFSKRTSGMYVGEYFRTVILKQFAKSCDITESSPHFNCVPTIHNRLHFNRNVLQ
jgi:hypothetical protein